jgi:hypothetical protein
VSDAAQTVAGAETRRGACVRWVLADLDGLLAGLVVYWLSIYISRLYTTGDQITYRAVYEIVSGLSLVDAYELYNYKISNGEAAYFLLIWLGANLGLEKDVLMSCANAVLAAYALRLFRQWGAARWISLLIVLTCSYFYVLYFAAERLKFGILFLVLAMLSSRSLLRVAIYTVLSVGSHLSVAIIFVGGVASQLVAGKTPDRSGSRIPAGVAVFLMLCVLGLVEHDYLYRKVSEYISLHQPGYGDFVPLALLIGLSCYYSRRYLEVILVYSPLIVGVGLMGGSRLNMLAYFVFLYYGLQRNAGVNLGILATTSYLAYKSYVFVANVLEYGNAFP